MAGTEVFVVGRLRRERRQFGHTRTRSRWDALKNPLFGGFKQARSDVRNLGPLQRIPKDTKRYRDNEEVDYCVIGVGSAGGVLLQRLAKSGFSFVGLEVC